ncbi:peptide/nickel transport system substrate-binding protein [Lacrimispora xylanisolvens]|uniref:Peptide/nickel transport system substrate-binding protein n=1 Tax=Lacrimispora xylanisolvens TaxID=384636 RepID=A0A2S6HYP2_9FIRM|nr:ABC transporter substrate-binding protein [Hungatella xylanolytica]MBE5986254.1 ABC transporter substrate-binding protein [Paenibacillaceae bacterium]PPK83262.1 peptide/nickel transport system substrate-binding protein [Hungatella xylanolytica]
MKKNFMKRAGILLAAVMVLGGLTACGGKDPAAEGTTAVSGSSAGAGETTAEAAKPSEGGESTFTYAIAGDPGANVNVITTSDRFGLMTIKMIYSPLYMYNADGINYFLAKSIDTSDDNLTYTMHLRDDVKWSDGEKFTADDVVFTFEAMEKEENAGWAYSQLVYKEGAVKIEKVDDYTVKLTMPFVNSAAVEMFSQIFIMPKHVYENVTNFENNDVNTKPVGTGPYVMSEYSAGSYVKFTKNENYFLGAPSIDNIVYRIIENENTAMTAIQSGEVDAWIGTPAQVAQMNLDSANLTVYPYQEGRVAYMMINAARVQNEDLRKAILYALDKKAIADAALLSSDYYDLPWSFMPPNSKFFTEDVEKYEQNLEKSKEYLAASGVQKPELNLAYSGSDTLQSTSALLVQEQLEKAGFKVTLSGIDSKALSQQMKDKNNTYDMYFGGYIMGIDPDTFSSLFETGAAYNYMYYDQPEINEMFAQGRKETDETKRKEIYTNLQKKIQDTACFYPLYSNKRLLVVSKNVSGIDAAKLVPVYTFEDTSKLQKK